MLYRRPNPWSLRRLWVRLTLAGHRRRATQDVRGLSAHLKRDLGLTD